MTELTYEKLKELACDVVADRGENFVYPGEWYDNETMSCRYSQPENNSAPACIVGCMADRLGALNLMTEGKYASSSFRLAGFDLSLMAREFVDSLQESQDEGYPWGYALRMAIHSAEHC